MRHALAILSLVVAAGVAHADQELPIFDAHMHYSHDAWTVVPPKEVVEILKLPEVQAQLTADGSEPAPVSAAEFRASMLRELDRWDKVIKAINFKLDAE